MSTNKRQNSPDEAAEGNDEAHYASPRKRSRPSIAIEADKSGRLMKPDVNRDGTHQRPIPPSPNSFPYSGPPELFDVTPGLPDAIFSLDDETPYWKTDHVAFINSAAGLGDANWIGKRPLGSGTFGTAGLWELSDENNIVIEQIVVKESKTIPVERWTGEVPEEVLMMRRMNKTDCQAVPHLIDYKRYSHVRKHRIYMECCPHSDLAKLDLNYKRFRTYLPEPFLWYTFKNLVKVAAAMKNGPEDSRWGYQIVHRDLKPANVFLGLEDDNCGFPSYPVAKTGDWGLARKTKHDDYTNPIYLRAAGTKAYYAPEQRVHCSGEALKTEIHRHLDGTAPLPKLSAHTNIWGIGAIMFELLTHEAVVCYLTGDEWARNEVFHTIPNLRNPKYSHALVELIRLCLMPDPWDRPSIEELEMKIGASCQSILDEYAANPTLRQQDRLYYKGSEINQMPPGNKNYWHPVLEDVQRPSESPDSNEPKNPFTSTIIYPHFPTSETDGPEEEGEVAQDGDDDDDQMPRGPKDGGAGNVLVVSEARPKSNNAENPILLSDSVEDHGVDEEGEGDEVNEGDEGDESNGSAGRESSGERSDDSDARRRMAIKKPPGT